MKHAFSVIRAILMKLLAHVLVYACKKFVKHYDLNKDGVLQPGEFAPLVHVVNIINKGAQMEDSLYGTRE